MNWKYKIVWITKAFQRLLIKNLLQPTCNKQTSELIQTTRILHTILHANQNPDFLLNQMNWPCNVFKLWICSKSKFSFKSENIRTLRSKKIIIHFYNILNKCIRQKNSSKMNTDPLRLGVILLTFLFILQMLSSICVAEPLGNPYHILGITRHASLKDIRKAYKNLAKEW